MPECKELSVSCNLDTRHSRFLVNLTELWQDLSADDASIERMHCMDCRISWQPSGTDEDYPVDSYCPGCYSSKVRVTKVRVRYENWGEQNGGQAQMLARYEEGLRKTKHG